MFASAAVWLLELHTISVTFACLDEHTYVHIFPWHWLLLLSMADAWVHPCQMLVLTLQTVAVKLTWGVNVTCRHTARW